MTRTRTLLALGAAGLVLATAACERPPVDTAQIGFRGVAMETVTNPRIDATLKARNTVPEPITPAPPGDPAPPGTWQNVAVLGNLSVAEFNRTMLAMQSWVSPTSGPEAGCAYCHNVANMASDEKYTKVVARRMLQMTQHINATYTGHVAQTGVTCYTCHRGQPVPQNIWFYTDRYQPLRHYLDRTDIRVQGGAALPADADNRSSIKQTEYAYAVMINMSTALGVNCTFCHNSRNWASWEQSTPKRIVAYRGLSMVRDLNMNYLVPLQGIWPANRLGMHGDGPKLMCSTCHQGVNKPLYGAPMAKDYPGMYPAAPTGTDAVRTTAMGGAPATPTP